MCVCQQPKVRKVATSVVKANIPTCSMVHGRLQRNYHVCIRHITTTTGVLAVPIQTTGVLAMPIHAGAISRQGDHSCKQFVSLQARRRCALVAREAIESGGTRSCRANTLTFCRPETLREFLSSIHAPPRVSCSSGTLHV